MDKLLRIRPADVGGLKTDAPWVLLDGSEKETEVFLRLRHNPPRGVFLTSSAALLGFLQAWRRAHKPDVIVATSADVLNKL